jgi:hypothetical protein
MTLIYPTTTTTKRRRKRSKSAATTTSAPTRSTGVRVVRGILTGVWLVGVPAFAGFYVDRNFGTPFGSIPLGDDPAGLNIAAAAAAVAALLVAYFLHHKHAITLLAVLPAVTSWIGYVAFDGGLGGWLGLLAGLGIGAITYAVRRLQGTS